MPTHGQVLFALLSASAAVDAIAADRIYPVRLPQGAAMPAVAYQLISRPPGAGYRGCEEPDQARVQLSLFARTYAQLDELDGVIRSLLDGYEDATSSIHYLDSRDLYDNQSDIYYRATDYRVELSPVTS